MKLPAKIIIATGQFMNVTVEIEIDTENVEVAKQTVRELHKHFFGLLDPRSLEEKKTEF